MLMRIPHDKMGHFIAGILIYAAVHFIDPFLALGVVVVAGIGKEIYDYINRDKHTPDIWDAFATVAGGAVGFICGV
jgi:hypothetical protein